MKVAWLLFILTCLALAFALSAFIWVVYYR